MTAQRAPVQQPTDFEAARLLATEQEGWRYATEVEAKLESTRDELLRANARIESMEPTATRYNAAMEAYANSREPHTTPTAHDPAGCIACEGRRRLDALLASHRATQKRVTVAHA